MAGLGVDVVAGLAGLKGDPVEEGPLGGAEDDLLGLLGVPFAAVVHAAVAVGAFRQEPSRGSLELDADLDLEHFTFGQFSVTTGADVINHGAL